MDFAAFGVSKNFPSCARRWSLDPAGGLPVDYVCSSSFQTAEGVRLTDFYRIVPGRACFVELHAVVGFWCKLHT